MKKFVSLALLLALGAFAVGCEKKATEPAAPAEPAATDAPAEGHTEAPAE